MNTGIAIKEEKYDFVIRNLDLRTILRLEQENFMEEGKKAIIVRGPRNCLVMVKNTVLDRFIPIDKKELCGELILAAWGSDKVSFPDTGHFYVATPEGITREYQHHPFLVGAHNPADFIGVVALGTPNYPTVTLQHCRAKVITFAEAIKIKVQLEKALRYRRRLPIQVTVLSTNILAEPNPVPVPEKSYTGHKTKPLAHPKKK